MTEKRYYFKELIEPNTELYEDCGHTLLYTITCPFCKKKVNVPEAKQLTNFIDGYDYQCEICDTKFIIKKHLT